MGAIPYLNGVEEEFSVSSDLSPPLPVEPINVTLLRFEGDVGALGTRVSALPEADIEVGTPRNPSSCLTFLLTSTTSSVISVE